MSDKIELLPCPFCGCADIASSIDWDRGEYKSCNDCGAETGAFGTEAEASAAWNRRAALAQQPATAAPVAVWQEPVAWVSVADRLPKSGVTVLACYTNSHGKLRRIRAEYVAPKSRVADYPCDTDEECVEYDEAADQHYWLPGWYECVDNWSDYTSLAVTEGEVSHWMQLPAAPGETAPPAAEQPDAVKVPRETLRELFRHMKNERNWYWRDRLRPLLEGGEA